MTDPLTGQQQAVTSVTTSPQGTHLQRRQALGDRPGDETSGAGPLVTAKRQSRCLRPISTFQPGADPPSSRRAALAWLRIPLRHRIVAAGRRRPDARREFDPIRKERRRTDRVVVAAFDDIRARTLGAILDLLAQVLNALPGIRLAEHPWMADFARVLAAIDQVAG